jgi:hypothetical protein
MPTGLSFINDRGTLMPPVKIDWDQGIPLTSFGIIGEQEAIRAFIKNNPTWAKVGARQAARQFLSIQSAATPETVNQPYSILIISPPEGAQWVERGACPEIVKDSNGK